jgi:hypothetical protein
MLETPGQFRQRVGRVDIGPSLEFRSRGQVIRDFVIALLLVLVCAAGSVWAAWPALRSVCMPLLAFAAYCTLAYFVRVRPNHDELGLGGGLIEHPLRWSDGGNRFLLRLVVFFAIGRFISGGLVDGWRLLRRGQLPQDQFMQDLEAGIPDDRT